MSVFIITGKLGNGKTIGGVFQILDHLSRGCPVATNLDINISQLCGRYAKTPVIFRLKDRPDVSDLETIGLAYPKNQPYNEEKFGALVLDECGTWLNSRNWNDEGRKELIEYLLHIRKRRWNVYLIIQDINMMDKQVREALGEHVVYMRRMDNVPVPFLSGFVKFFTGKRVTFKKKHIGVVKYGTNIHSLTVDKWNFLGEQLYSSYDTEQIFVESYPHGTYQYLTPYLLNRNQITIKNKRYYMKLTKIFLRKYSKLALLGFGLFAGMGASFAGMTSYFENQLSDIKGGSNKEYQKKLNSMDFELQELKEQKEKLDNKLLKLSSSKDVDISAELNSIDFIDRMLIINDVRLSGYVIINNKSYGYLDFYENGNLKDSLTFSQLNTYGWTITIKDDVLKVSKESHEYFVTSWRTGKAKAVLGNQLVSNVQSIKKSTRTARIASLSSKVGSFYGKE